MSLELIDKVLKDKKLTDLTKPTAEPVPRAEVTEQQIEQAVGLLVDVEKNGGTLKIARKCKISLSLLGQIQQKMQEKVASLQPVEVPSIPDEMRE